VTYVESFKFCFTPQFSQKVNGFEAVKNNKENRTLTQKNSSGISPRPVKP
jgi:hypothetical protein